jgi:predicted MFS family arabinose efflux permease
MYHIRDVLYEMSIKINHLCVPANKNVLMLTQKEIRPLYDKLTKMVSHSNSLRQLFSNNNFYSLMKDMDRINNKIEELFRLETSLENIQEKLKFEAKNKEYVITNVFINSNQSLIKIIHSIQTIEKKISECQLRIKENNLQQYHHVVNQMILLISFFSMLLIFSFLLRYHFEKNIIANQAEGKDASARLKSSVNRKLIFSAIFLLIISLSFNALLTLGSLEKLYVESTVSQYRIIGTDLQRNIDRSLRYGKRIDKFVGMDRILSETKYSLTTKYLKGQARIQWKDIDLNVAIALPDWKIIYSTDKNMIDTQMPKAARVDYTDKIKENASKTLSDWTEYKDRYYITLPVKGGESKDWAGTVIIDFNDTQIKAFLKNIFVNNMKMIGAILMIGSLLLIISLTFIVYRSKNNLPRILISIVMLIIIGISQAVFSLINSYEFKKFYLQINIQKSEIMTKMLKEDIDYLLSKGVKIHKLVKMENLMKEVIDVSPELKDISIFDSNDKILHLANKDMAIDFNRSPIELQKIDLSQSDNDPEFQLKKKLIKVTDSESTQPVYKGTIITNISKAALFDKIFEIRIDSATVFIISILFMVELLIMIFRIIRSSSQTEAKKTKIEFSDIRPVTFIFFFAFDLCISFLPLYMEQLYVPMFGLSKDIVLSLPIAGEMFFAGITSIIVGWLLDRVNWHLPFLYGLIICSIGSFYSWLSPDAYHLLFARCFTGIGYGLSFMAGQGFVVTYTDNKTKTQGLTQLFAGLMAGSICGGAAGAMIADRIGFAPIFFISAVLLIVTVLYTLYFMRGGFQKKVVKKITEEQGVVKEKQGLLLLKFIFNRNIASLLILGILPTAFSIVGFINFFYPVYLNRLGETQSNIGRIYMIYGLCLIYIAPMLSKFVDRSDNKKLFIVITGMIGGLAFTTFYFMGGLWATVVTVLLLGVSSSFDASRTYALNLNITKTLGEGTAMGIFNLAEKIGQVVGPIIFGLFFITASLNNTMAAFGAIYIIITLLFLFTAQSDKKLKRLERG